VKVREDVLFHADPAQILRITGQEIRTPDLLRSPTDILTTAYTRSDKVILDGDVDVLVVADDLAPFGVEVIDGVAPVA
jgi:hypothetical protein